MTPEQHTCMIRGKDQAAASLRAENHPAADWLERAAVQAASRAQQGDADDAPPQLILSAPGSLSPSSNIAFEMTTQEVEDADEAFWKEHFLRLVRDASAAGRLPHARPG